MLECFGIQHRKIKSFTPRYNNNAEDSHIKDKNILYETAFYSF